MIAMDATQLLELFPQQHPIGEIFAINNVVIDSRQPCAGALFVALKGEHFDGHEFVAVAQEKGAVAVVVEHEVDVNIPQLLVPDSKQALADLARFWRRQSKATVVAITGSNGKTTVKEMLGQILSSQQQTLKTAGNLNNDIGVPLTLFRLSDSDSFAVIEMGANHVGEIRQLVQIAEPDIVYVNNARPAHVEGFGSLQAVIEAKGEMYQYCSPGAIAVFNMDEPANEYWRSVSKASHQWRFSLQQMSDVSAEFENSANGLVLTVTGQGEQASCELKVQGAHNAHNALAAITLALACGLTLQQAVTGLQDFNGVKGRQQFIRGINDCLIIDDSYNANPDSLAAAIEVLCALKGEAWLALGDMAELGEDSAQMHQQAVQNAKHSGVKKLYALGERSCQAAAVFGDDGYCFSEHAKLADFVRPRLNSNVNLLIKGSRSAQMEKLVMALTSRQMSSTSGGQHAV